MKKGYKATTTAIEITKILLSSAEIKRIPTAEDAKNIAEFISTLADSLEPIAELLQE